MARPVTFIEMKTRARQRADMENSTFIKESELNFYINDSLAELYDILVQKFGANYYLKQFTITTAPGVLEYDLPVDFYKINGVDLVRGNSDSNLTLKPFMFIERNSRTFFDNYRYRLLGNKIHFLDPDASREILVWYVPISERLVLDTDTFDGINGYEEYVIIDAAIKMKEKEESDIQGLLVSKQMMNKRIEEAAENRDEGSSDRVTDVTSTVLDGFLF